MESTDTAVHWLRFFLSGWGIGFIVYAVLQILAALRIRERRGLILLPAPFMLGVLIWTMYAYSLGSNLWPVPMIFASVLASIVVILLWVIIRHAERVATR
jgi:hypothetical protein